jgi:hypothetical protein
VKWLDISQSDMYTVNSDREVENIDSEGKEVVEVEWRKVVAKDGGHALNVGT